MRKHSVCFIDIHAIISIPDILGSMITYMYMHHVQLFLFFIFENQQFITQDAVADHGSYNIITYIKKRKKKKQRKETKRTKRKRKNITKR